MPATPLPARIIAFAKKLDLGREPASYCDLPCGPAVAKPRKWFPNLWIEAQKEPIDLPRKGRAIIDYAITRQTTTTTDGETRHEASLEVQAIEPYEPKKDAKPKNTITVPVKLGARAPLLRFSSFPLLPRLFHFARSRNSDGQFAPEDAETGITPETTAKAYGAMGQSPSLLRKAVGPAVAGGTAAGADLLARALLKKKTR